MLLTIAIRAAQPKHNRQIREVYLCTRDGRINELSTAIMIIFFNRLIIGHIFITSNYFCLIYGRKAKYINGENGSQSPSTVTASSLNEPLAAAAAAAAAADRPRAASAGYVTVLEIGSDCSSGSRRASSATLHLATANDGRQRQAANT